MALKIDSNVAGLRFAEEASLKTLPGSPVWYPLDPNSYSDFGGQLATVARRPINQTRQQKKGTVTDLDASGGFNQDLTQKNLTRLLQGILFADIREKATSTPMNAAANPITSVVTADDSFNAGAGLGSFLVNGLILASGFSVAGNNGLHKVVTAAAAKVTVTTNLVDEGAPPATAKIETVGYEFAAATLDVTIVGGLPRLARASGVFDFTTLALVPGEWIYVGGDVAGNTFADNVGFARVKAVAATYIELDKTSWTPQAEVGAGKSIRIFFGSVVKNESAANLIKRKTYHVERTLGEDANGTMSEYLTGAVANEFTLNIAQADKVTFDLSFVALDNEQRTGLQGLKAGTRPSLTNEDPFNTTSDFSRIKLSTVDPANSNPTALFAFATEITLNINNNVQPNKAIGVLGAFETSAGILEVGGSLTAYFADVPALQAVRNNADITIDIIMAKQNAGIAIDIPLMSLGNGRLNVEQDQAITLPLDMNAAESPFGHSVLVSVFPYLPTAAQ